MAVNNKCLTLEDTALKTDTYLEIYIFHNLFFCIFWEVFEANISNIHVFNRPGVAGAILFMGITQQGWPLLQKSKI